VQRTPGPFRRVENSGDKEYKPAEKSGTHKGQRATLNQGDTSPGQEPRHDCKDDDRNDGDVFGNEEGKLEQRGLLPKTVGQTI